jgi:hypothetical protein
VYAYAPGRYQFFVMGWARGCNSAKRDLAFAKLWNDGESEGSFMFDRLPTRTEATAIRRWLGVSKKRTISEVELARLRSLTFPKAALLAITDAQDALAA